jgi:uncharacterized iron-regulated membrane protein
MEIGLVLGMLFLWTILTGLTVFLYRELSRTNKPEVRHVRVEVDPEQDPFQFRDKL